jgi:hypothetical protein
MCALKVLTLPHLQQICLVTGFHVWPGLGVPLSELSACWFFSAMDLSSCSTKIKLWSVVRLPMGLREKLISWILGLGQDFAFDFQVFI